MEKYALQLTLELIPITIVFGVEQTRRQRVLRLCFDAGLAHLLLLRLRTHRIEMFRGRLPGKERRDGLAKGCEILSLRERLVSFDRLPFDQQKILRWAFDSTAETCLETPGRGPQ